MKKLTDNHKNDRVHNMNQNNPYTGSNDKKIGNILFKHSKAQQKSKSIQFLPKSIGGNSIKHNKNHIPVYNAPIPK